MQAIDSGEMSKHAEEAAELLRKLANSRRLMVLCTLVDGEMSVGEINNKVPLSQSALSQHLAALRKASLVSTRREAQTIYYSLNGDKATRIMAVLQDMYCPKAAGKR